LVEVKNILKFIAGSNCIIEVKNTKESRLLSCLSIYKPIIFLETATVTPANSGRALLLYFIFTKKQPFSSIAIAAKSLQ